METMETIRNAKWGYWTNVGYSYRIYRGRKSAFTKDGKRWKDYHGNEIDPPERVRFQGGSMNGTIFEPNS